MIPGEGRKTSELFEDARRHLADLEKLVSLRRNRDKACTTLTDLYLLVEGIARRIREVEFSEKPLMSEPEEAEERETTRLTMQDLLDAPQDNLEEGAAAEEGVTVRELRLRYFRAFLDYQAAGCRTFEEMMLKGIALVRRLRPHMLERFGISMASVGRKTGRSRANVHALERRMIDELLKARQVRGRLLGGQRSEEHRRKCSEAQKGNTNRRDGERRKRGGSAD